MVITLTELRQGDVFFLLLRFVYPPTENKHVQMLQAISEGFQWQPAIGHIHVVTQAVSHFIRAARMPRVITVTRCTQVRFAQTHTSLSSCLMSCLWTSHIFPCANSNTHQNLQYLFQTLPFFKPLNQLVESVCINSLLFSCFAVKILDWIQDLFHNSSGFIFTKRLENCRFLCGTSNLKHSWQCQACVLFKVFLIQFVFVSHQTSFVFTALNIEANMFDLK